MEMAHTLSRQGTVMSAQAHGAFPAEQLTIKQTITTHSMAQKVKQIAIHPDLAKMGLNLNPNMLINNNHIRSIT